MKIDSFLIALVIALMIIIVGVAVIDEQATAYNYSIEDPMFANVTDNFNAIANLTNTQKRGTQTGDVENSDALDNLISAAFTAVTLVWGGIGAITDIIFAIGESIGVPPIILSTAILILTISIIFTIIYMMMRFQPR